MALKKRMGLRHFFWTLNLGGQQAVLTAILGGVFRGHYGKGPGGAATETNSLASSAPSCGTFMRRKRERVKRRKKTCRRS